MTRPRLLALVGPTASGKTAVACEIAKRLPIEVVSCDSMQVYRSMPLLTQAPPKLTRVVGASGRSPLLRTHLVSFLDPREEYNAARFRLDAQKAVASIHKKGRVPFLVGGTGLYLRALLDGLFDDPLDSGRDEVYRKKCERFQKKHGGTYLHDRLKRVDAPSAAKIHPNDHRRLVRALEVHHRTGRPISEHQPKRAGLRVSHDCRIVLLDLERTELYERINTRVDLMIRNGLVREVRRLRSIRLSQTASAALGLREIGMYLDAVRAGLVPAQGRPQGSPLQQAILLLKQHTRNYAKRQLSWFRHERGVEPVSVASKETAKKTAEKILRLWEKT